MKNPHRPIAASIFALLVSFGLAGFQAPSGHEFAPNAPSESIPNLDKTSPAEQSQLKAELKQYHDCTCTCGCYTKDLNLQADRAIEYLRKRVPHPGAEKNLAVVFDIDETTLSNFREMLGADFAYDSKTFNAWVNSAKAPAIAGTLRVYKEARRLGLHVVFLTGRPVSQRAATERNLRDQGFASWQRLILRQPDQAKTTALQYKSAVRAEIAKNYEIILNVGDQWSDLKGDPEAEFSVKYPDPFYYIQ